MTNEELDEARAKETLRELEERNTRYSFLEVATLAARLARENWTPPEPVVDPDVLAFREWEASHPCPDYYRKEVLEGKRDYGIAATAYLAGARMAREREQERANPVVAFAVRVKAGVFNDLDHAKREARKAIDEYEGEA